jgi:H+/gluconate symporter-like permease
MLSGIFLLSIFLAMAVLMFLRKLPVLIALPLMAIAIAAVGGIPFSDIISLVVGKGSIRLAEACTVTMFGGMLSFLLQKSGVAESFIKKGAELSGDDPWKVGVVMMLLIIVLFTTIGGLGAIIMVATIVLPIMASVGIPPLVAAGLFLIGLSTGGILNAGNWAVYIGALHLDVPTVRNYALLLFGASFLSSLLFLTVELRRARKIKSLRPYAIRGGVIIAILSALLVTVERFASDELLQTGATVLKMVAIASEYILAAIGVFALAMIFRDAMRSKEGSGTAPRVRWYAYLIPLVPLVLILVYEMHFVAAFFIALLYGYGATYRKGSLNMLTQSVIEGSASVMPAVILMFGIGMLLNAIIGPSDYAATHSGAEWSVVATLRPLLSEIIPSTWIGYLLLFTLAAPLALYRGPLNVWGLGYGIAAVMLATGKIGGPAIMGMLLSVGQIQGVCDPTNTQNVWMANELKLDIQQLMWRTLPYMWLLAFVGLLISVFLFYQ